MAAHDEQTRRKALAALLSDDNLNNLIEEVKQAREALLSSSSEWGCAVAVTDLSITLENIIVALNEFSDSRTDE